MKDITKNFGKRLQEIRKAKGYTQARLAELAELEVQTISRIESGARFPQKENIEKFAEILDCEIKDLFEFNYIKTKTELLSDIKKKLNKASLIDLKYYNKMIDSYTEAQRSK